MATHSSIHTWKILWTEETGWLQSTGSQRVIHDWARMHTLGITCHPTVFSGMFLCEKVSIYFIWTLLFIYRKQRKEAYTYAVYMYMYNSSETILCLHFLWNTRHTEKEGHQKISDFHYFKKKFWESRIFACLSPSTPVIKAACEMLLIPYSRKKQQTSLTRQLKIIMKSVAMGGTSSIRVYKPMDRCKKKKIIELHLGHSDIF